MFPGPSFIADIRGFRRFLQLNPRFFQSGHFIPARKCFQCVFAGFVFLLFTVQQNADRPAGQFQYRRQWNPATQIGKIPGIVLQLKFFVRCQLLDFSAFFIRQFGVRDEHHSAFIQGIIQISCYRNTVQALAGFFFIDNNRRPECGILFQVPDCFPGSLSRADNNRWNGCRFPVRNLVLFHQQEPVSEADQDNKEKLQDEVAQIDAQLSAMIQPVITNVELDGLKLQVQNINAQIAHHENLVNELKECKKQIRIIEKSKESLADKAREQISENDARKLITSRWLKTLHETISQYLEAHARMLQQCVELLYDKYTVTLGTLINERKKATDELEKYLKELGYTSK